MSDSTHLSADNQTTTDLKLADLATEIRTHHDACRKAVGVALVHAMAAGDLLLAAKAECRHGEWQSWLSQNLGFTDRTARTYMRLAKHRSEIEAKTEDSSVLSIDGAIKLLAKPVETERDATSNVEIELNPNPGFMYRIIGMVDRFDAVFDIWPSIKYCGYYYTRLYVLDGRDHAVESIHPTSFSPAEVAVELSRHQFAATTGWHRGSVDTPFDEDTPRETENGDLFAGNDWVGFAPGVLERPRHQRTRMEVA